MAILDWHDVRLLQALEVAPVWDENENAEVYKVTRLGLRLNVTSWPHHDCLHLSISTEPDGAAITSFFIVVCQSIDYINDRRGQILECTGCFLGVEPFSEGVFETMPPNLSFTLQVLAKPRIEIRFV